MVMNSSDSIILRHGDWNLLRIHLNWAFEEQKNETILINNPYSSYHKAMWIRKGHASLRSGRHTLEAKTGEWIFLSPGKQRVQLDANTDYISICFSVFWTGSGEMLMNSHVPFWKTDNQPELEDASLLLTSTIRQTEYVQFHLYNKQMGWESYFHFRYLFDKWLIPYMRILEKYRKGWWHIENKDKRVMATITYLQEKPLNESLDLAEISLSQGVSRRQLCRLFQQEYGMTPNMYWEKIRLNAAVRMLQTTQQEIKQIAATFDLNKSPFCTWLKKKAGATPTDIRKGSGTPHT